MKNSPKQTLLRLLPLISQIYLRENLNVIPLYKPYHYKNSCGFDLKLDSEIKECLVLGVNDPEEIAKKIFWIRWKEICKEVDNILESKFKITSYVTGTYFRTLRLK